MALFAFRTLVTALGLSLAAGSQEAPLPPAVAYLVEDVAFQAEDLHASMAWQNIQLKERLATLTQEALKNGRRLQSTAPCLWSNNMCSLSPAYFNEKAAQLPQGSPMQRAVAVDAFCGTLKDTNTCSANVTCMWNDGPKTCNVKVGDQMNKIGSALFDAASCGTSPGANILKMMSVPGPCEGLAQTDCTANTKCSWNTDYALTGTTCTPVGSCGKGDGAKLAEAVAMLAAMCPSGYDAKQAAVDCAKTVDSSNKTAMALCGMQGCPIMYNIYIASATLTPICTKLTSQTACAANSQCAWKEQESSIMTNVTVMTCQPQIDKAAIMLQDVPDACRLKGLMLSMGKCERVSSEGACTGDCSWQTELSCEWMGTPKNKSGCSPSAAAMNKGLAGGGPAALLGQAAATCQSATTQAACTAVVRPSEAASVAGATRMWLAAPSLLAALFAVSAVAHLV